jgi:hypothetical protein
MEVRAMIPPTSSNEVHLSWTLLSSGFAGPFPLVFARGPLGLDPAVLVTVSMPPHNNQTGVSLLALPIPNEQRLVGMRIPSQAATFASQAGTLTFGNTAQLTIN